MTITKDTKLIVSFASKQSSVGAAMHNAGYQALGLNFIYVPIATDDIANAIAGVRGFGLVGNTVSMPHKREVMKHLDKVDEVAQKIGAVNTVRNKDGILTGYNSDWVGATEALKEVIELSGKKAIVLGAGGAARAIVYGLKHSGAEVDVLNRDQTKGQSLADDFDAHFGGNLEDLENIKDYDILINATSVGFGTEESPVQAADIKEGCVVMDVVFIPNPTVFMKQAESRSCKVVPGYRMLIHQALFQFELFTGQKPPFEVMEKALMGAL